MIRTLLAALALAGAFPSHALAHGVGLTDADPAGLVGILGLGLVIATAFALGSFAVANRPVASRLCLVFAALAVL